MPSYDDARTWDGPRRGGSGGRREIRLRGGRAGPDQGRKHEASGVAPGIPRHAQVKLDPGKVFLGASRRRAAGVEQALRAGGRRAATSLPTTGPRTKLGHPRGRQPLEAVETGAGPRPAKSRRLVTRRTCQWTAPSGAPSAYADRLEGTHGLARQLLRQEGGAVSTGVDQEQSLGELVASASRDLSLLVHKEVELAKAEISAEVKRAGIGAGFLGGAGFTGFFTLTFLSVAGALGISAGFDIGEWAGFLIVGGAYGLLAGLLGLMGLRKVTKVKPPQRTIRTVKDDIAWAKHPTVAPDPELEDLRASHTS